MVGTFKIGEKVVYPAHGVGVIEGVQTKVISGSERKFYMLRIIDSDMTIMIPTENVQSVGLRRIIGKDMVAKVYRILRDKKVEIDQQTWNRRYREYTEKIKTGSVLEIAKVLKCFQECLLHCVARVVAVSEHADQGPVNAPAVPVNEILECI